MANVNVENEAITKVLLGNQAVTVPKGETWKVYIKMFNHPDKPDHIQFVFNGETIVTGAAFLTFEAVMKEGTSIESVRVNSEYRGRIIMTGWKI